MGEIDLTTSSGRGCTVVSLPVFFAVMGVVVFVAVMAVAAWF